MKKKTFLMSLPLLATLILSACAGHVHSFSEEWSHDAESHWHECTAGDGARDGEAPHEWGEGEVTIQPTCTEAGERTYTCICGETKKEAINPLGHSASEDWQWDEEHHWHNCTHDGCYEELDMDEHTFKEDEEKRVDSTCTTKGKKFLECTVCGYEKEEELPLAEHSWDDGITTKQPSCLETGEKTFTCSVCKRTKTETLPAAGHKWESKGSNEPFQYSGAGTWEECSVCHAKKNEVVTQTAPWTAFDFADEDNVICLSTDAEEYDRQTHTLTTSKYKSEEGVKFILADIIGEGKLVFDVTVTVNGQTSWGPQGSFFFFGDQSEELGSVFCLGKNPFQDKDEHPTQFNTTVIENGVEVETLSQIGAEFTYRFDFRTFDKAPSSLVINGANGQPDTPDIISIKSIVAKETICGHKASEVAEGTIVESTCKVAGYTPYVCGHENCGNVEYKVARPLKDHTPVETTADGPYQYTPGGQITACSVCGKTLDDSKAIPAPWLRLDPKAPGDDCTLKFNGNDSYTSTSSAWTNSVYFSLPADLEGRTQLAVTFKAPETWDLYFYIGEEGGNQIVTASGKINWGQNGLVSEVLGPIDNSLNYNTTTYSIGAKVGTNLTTIIYDLSKATWTTEGKDVILCLYAVGTYTAYVDLRTPCDHTTTEAISTGSSCGEKCSSCGRFVSSFIDGVEKTTPSGKDSYFSYETGVTFDGRKDCLKTRTTAYTNNADMCWAVNYKVRFLNLVKNARAANKPLIKLNFYISASATDNMRLGWGVQTNDNLNYSGAQADHWNYAQTVFVGTNDVASNSSISTETNPGVESKAPANQWLVLTVDVSGDAFADATNFFISANIDSSGTHDRYPIETYISNINCVAK